MESRTRERFIFFVCNYFSLIASWKEAAVNRTSRAHYVFFLFTDIEKKYKLSHCQQIMVRDRYSICDNNQDCFRK